MLAFDQSTVTTATPEKVWKLLYDPSRFPEWWAGVGSVEAGGDAGDYTMFPDGYPDFPMPQMLEVSQDQGSVKISCLVSDLCFGWRLRPAGAGTEISVHVEIPDDEAHRSAVQQDLIRQSLHRLAGLAAKA
jgi:Polyketide cyclase / dehydrase and lipid transport